MDARLGFFIQALFTLFIGIYLSSQGVPSVTEIGGQIIDSLDQVSDNPQVHEVAENTKSSFNKFGKIITIASVLEIIGLGVSLFAPKRGGGF